MALIRLPYSFSTVSRKAALFRPDCWALAKSCLRASMSLLPCAQMAPGSALGAVSGVAPGAAASVGLDATGCSGLGTLYPIAGRGFGSVALGLGGALALNFCAVVCTGLGGASTSNRGASLTAALPGKGTLN